MFYDLLRVADRTSLLDCLTTHRDDVAIIAGGTDFVALYASDAITASHVVDIRHMPELNVFRHAESALQIGAAVPLVAVAREPVAFAGAVSDGAALVGSTQTRARATLGGNICRASPSGDCLPGLLVAKATLVTDSRQGERRLNPASFFLGPGKNGLTDGEYLARVEIPRTGNASAYVRSTVRKAMDLATVGVAVSLDVEGDTIRGGRIAVGGAGPVPLCIPDVGEILAGSLSNVEACIEDLDATIQQHISPIDDVRASAWYRRKLITPVVERALVRARQRARQTQEAA